MDIMIDLETLGTRPDAAIIQIGAVLFEAKSGGRLLNGKGFNRHVMIQDGSGSIDHGAVAFWLQEKSANRMGNLLENGAETLDNVLRAFVDWPMNVEGISWQGITGVWANPSEFDLPILKSAFARIGQDVPWDRRATCDVRTLFNIAGRPDVDWSGLTAHDALDDAIGQAMGVQMAMNVLNDIVSDGAR